MKCVFFTFCILLMIFSYYVSAQNPMRSARTMRFGNRIMLPERKKPNDAQKKVLQPNAADLIKHAEFLRQPKTGIFRLLPDAGCEENVNIIRADKKCLESIPGSSFYSFREKEHTADYLADIRLKSDHLITDGIMAQSFMVSLGDVNLENITLKTDGLGFMQNYSAEPESAEMQKQFFQMARGVRTENFLYRKAFRAVENTAYALRVVAFRGNIYRTFRGYRYDLLDGDKRIDMTVAFRIIRKNADGSLTVLWKELDRRDAPKLKFTKRKKREK